MSDDRRELTAGAALERSVGWGKDDKAGPREDALARLISATVDDFMTGSLSAV